jgi:hypothetical protein
MVIAGIPCGVDIIQISYRDRIPKRSVIVAVFISMAVFVALVSGSGRASLPRTRPRGVLGGAIIRSNINARGYSALKTSAEFPQTSMLTARSFLHDSSQQLRSTGVSLSGLVGGKRSSHASPRNSPDVSASVSSGDIDAASGARDTNIHSNGAIRNNKSDVIIDGAFRILEYVCV